MRSLLLLVGMSILAVPGVSQAGAPPRVEAALVVLAPGPYLVLGAAKTEMRTGTPELLASRSTLHDVRWGVDLAKVGDVEKAWIGRFVALKGAAGAACTGTVRELSIMRRVDWGSCSTEAGEVCDLSNTSKEKLLEGVAALDNEDYLVGRVDDVAGDCANTRFAAPTAAKVATFEIAKAGSLEAGALGLFRKSTIYREIQAKYKVWVKETNTDAPAASWDVLNGAAPEVTLLKGDRRWVLVSALAQGECGSFNDSASILFEVDASGKLKAVTSTTKASPGIHAVDAVDVNGDGLPEILVPDGMFGVVGGEWIQLQRSEPTFFGCPC